MANSYEQVDGIVYEALQLAVDERSAFFDRVCGGDARLRREAESLLAAAEKMGEGYLETPVCPIRAEQRPDHAEGGRVGPYRISAEIGHGGMGRVYLAVRDDDEYEREVALKVLKRGLDTDEIVRRFRHERQILARLDHPHVATLFDGGTTEDGVPYFAMEHVRGEPVDRYCERRDLTVRQRLELLLKVCSAVHFAHQNLVIHRDLKPGNILVTEPGEPKLLDFGIAKLLDREGTALTVAGVRPMTPDYASPEQLRGEVVTTASDVYSLGRVLEEILAAGRWEPLQRRRRLDSDLESIVRKALEEEPRDRYGSVEQLADDLRRHLAGLPVLARQTTFLYQVGKFVRRHRWGVAMTAIALILGIAFSVGMTLLWLRAEQEREVAVRERQRAEDQQKRAEEITRFLVDVFRNPDPETSKGKEITARQLLGAGTRLIREGLAEQPEVRAALMHAMGQAYLGLALPKEAEPLLAESLSLYRESPEIQPEQLATCLFDLAAVRQETDRFDEAGELVREAFKILRQGDAQNPRLARALNNQAALANARGDVRGAEELYREALAMKLRLLGEEHADVALAKNNLGKVLRDLGKYDEAERLYRESLALRIEIHGEESTQVAVTRNNLALVLQDKGELDAAERRLRENLDLRRRLYAPNHPSVAGGLNNLAFLLRLRGNYSEAESLYDEAIEIYREKYGPEHSSVATVLRNKAVLYAAKGEAAKAEETARRALEVFRQSLPENHWRIADAESVLGGCLMTAGRHGEAEILLERSYAALQAARGNDSRQSREARQRLDHFRREVRSD